MPDFNGPNPGFLFYRKFYGSPPSHSAAISRQIEQTDAVMPIEAPALRSGSRDALRQLRFATTYPGLLCGSGYNHEAEGDNDAYKIGFFFDHSTGMPVIPGHSVKGVLRSAFSRGDADDRYGLIRSLLSEILPEACTDEAIDALEREIFDGRRASAAIPVYEKDHFLDAVPESIENNQDNRQSRRLFGSDYITPHKNRDGRRDLDPFSEPNPIKFLKVMPLVTFRFSFHLHPSQVLPAVGADEKLRLFQGIIALLGVGAKTAVGYGQMEVRP